MPFTRGTVRELRSSDPLTAGAIIVTNDNWNDRYSSVGVIPLRHSIAPNEAPNSVQLSNGLFAVASRLFVVHKDPDKTPLGAQTNVLHQPELDALEDRLCMFLDLPRLLGPSVRKAKPYPSTKPYPYWSEIYYIPPPIDGELKRFVVVSPDAWNATSGLVTVVRTTSKVKVDDEAFPPLQRGKACAACGDMTTVPSSAVKLGDRPDQASTTVSEIVSIARGIAATHQLQAAVIRNTMP